MALIFSCVSLDIATLSLVILTSVYLYFEYTYSYWQRRGIKSAPAKIPFGNFHKTFSQQKTLYEEAQEHYRNTTEPFIGLFAVTRPLLLVRDLDLIRHIMVKDFQHFVDRGTYMNEKVDPLSANLFALHGDKWRNLRTKLTPTFTPGKLKAMFSTVIACGAPLRKYMDHAASKRETLDTREISARYATNVIASVAFGVDVDCISNADTPFRRYGKKFFELTLKKGVLFALFFLHPKLLKTFSIRVADRDVEDFMTDLVQQTMDHREKNDVVRKDFFQLLLQLRNTGNVQRDDEWETVITADEKSKELTVAEMTAHAFVFFIAGFETTSTTISYCLFEIARNPYIQQRVHEEITEVLGRHNGQITYESASEMRYLENCIDETLRKYPPLPFLNRECTKEYKIPGTDSVLEKGTAVIIPLLALQRDENYFPDPLKFDPDRFSGNSSRASMTYMPFGDGPRHCIGMRLGKMQTKVALIIMLQNRHFELAEKEFYHKELEYTPANFLLIPKTGIQLKITPLTR